MAYSLAWLVDVQNIYFNLFSIQKKFFSEFGQHHIHYLTHSHNLLYTITIGTLSTKEAERIYTFKLLVSKLLGGGRGGLNASRVSKLEGGGGLGDLDNVQNLEVFF